MNPDIDKLHGSYSLWYGIYDVAEDRFWEDEDGEPVAFHSVIGAKNYLFTLGYKESYVELFLDFKLLAA